MSDESKSTDEEKVKGFIKLIGEMAYSLSPHGIEESIRKAQEERVAKEPPLIKELLKDSLFEKAWWGMDDKEDRNRTRQFMVEKQLSRQVIDDAINKIRTISGEDKEKLYEYDFGKYLSSLPLIFRLLELEKTDMGTLKYALEASYKNLGGLSCGLEDLDRLLHYFSLENLVKNHKEVDAETKENFIEPLDFYDISMMLTFHFSILSPYKARREEMKNLTEDEKKTLSSFVMSRIVELSKKGADHMQMIKVMGSFDDVVKQNIKSGKELTEKNMGEWYQELLVNPKLENLLIELKKYRERGLKYDKDGERIWGYVKQIPSVQEMLSKQDFKSRRDSIELERLYRRACRKQEMTYLEFTEVMNALKRLGGQSIDFNDLKWSYNSSDFLKEFQRLKRLIRDTKNESTLRDYIQKKHDFSWLVKNLKQVEQMLSLGIRRETALRMDARSYHGVEDASIYLRKLDGLREIIDDQKHQRLVSTVQMLLDSHTNLPFVGLALTYMQMGYTKKIGLSFEDNVESQIKLAFTEQVMSQNEVDRLIEKGVSYENIKMFREDSPVKNPQRLFEESEKDPSEFLLYVLNVPVRDAITRYIEETTRRMQRRGKHHEVEDDEPWAVDESEKYKDNSKISFFGTNLERLEKIISEYTLKNSATSYETAVEKRPIKSSDIVTASNVVSSVIPTLLNRLPQFYKSKMTLEQVLAYCEKELKQQSKLDNIMGITIKKSGMEQTVGEYVRYTIETRYRQLG